VLYFFHFGLQEDHMRATLPKIPQSVERTLGPEAAGDLGQWIEIIVVEHAVRRDEYREVLSRLDILEHDVVDLKDRITDLHHTMDERFDRMNAEMNQRFDRMNERFDQMYERMTTMIRWTVGTLALLGTIMTILMAIAQFT
jgi:tetrahydromethanopterin S-methyltransferase subunit G